MPDTLGMSHSGRNRTLRLVGGVLAGVIVVILSIAAAGVLFASHPKPTPAGPPRTRR